eukprot:10616-Heterococcus_DN1.PRE.1
MTRASSQQQQQQQQRSSDGNTVAVPSSVYEGKLWDLIVAFQNRLLQLYSWEEVLQLDNEQFCNQFIAGVNSAVAAVAEAQQSDDALYDAHSGISKFCAKTQAADKGVGWQWEEATAIMKQSSA